MDDEIKNIHGYISCSDEDSDDFDSKAEIDEIFKLLKPPPIQIDPLRHRIIEIGPEDDEDFIDTKHMLYSSVLKVNKINLTKAPVLVSENIQEGCKKVEKKKKRKNKKSGRNNQYKYIQDEIDRTFEIDASQIVKLSKGQRWRRNKALRKAAKENDVKLSNKADSNNIDQNLKQVANCNKTLKNVADILNVKLSKGQRYRRNKALRKAESLAQNLDGLSNVTSKKPIAEKSILSRGQRYRRNKALKKFAKEQATKLIANSEKNSIQLSETQKLSIKKDAEEIATKLCLMSNNVILSKGQKKKSKKALKKVVKKEVKQLNLESSEVSRRTQNNGLEKNAAKLCLNSNLTKGQRQRRNKALRKAAEEKAKQLSLETFDNSAKTQNRSPEEIAANLCLNSNNVILSKAQRYKRNKALRKAAEEKAKQLGFETSDVSARTQNPSNSSNVILSKGQRQKRNKPLRKAAEEEAKQLSLENFDVSARTQNQNPEETAANLRLNTNNVILTKGQRKRRNKALRRAKRQRKKRNKALRKAAEAEAKQLSLETSDVSARTQNQSPEENAANLCLNSSSVILSEGKENIRNKALQKATEEKAKQLSLETSDISGITQNQSLEEVAKNLCLNTSNVILSKAQRQKRNKALRKAAEEKAKQLSLETFGVSGRIQNQSPVKIAANLCPNSSNVILSKCQRRRRNKALRKAAKEKAANLCHNSSNVILSKGQRQRRNKALRKAAEAEAKQFSLETSDVSARTQNQSPEEIAANLCLNSSNVILSKGQRKRRNKALRRAKRQRKRRNKALRKAAEAEAKQLSLETSDVFAITQNQSLEEVAANLCLNSSNVILSEGQETIRNKALQKTTEETTKQLSLETFDISARTQNQSLEEVATNLCLNSSNVILTKEQRKRRNKALRKAAEETAKQLSLETSDLSARTQNQSPEEIAANLCLNSSNVILSEGQKNIRNKALQKDTEEKAKQLSLETSDICARTQNDCLEEVATNLCLNSSNVMLTKEQRKRRNKALRKAAEAEAKQFSLETSDVSARIQNQGPEEIAANLCLNSSNVILSKRQENIRNKALQKATEEEAKQLSVETFDIFAITQNQSLEEVAANLCLNSSNVILSEGLENILNKALQKDTEEKTKQMSLETFDISAKTQNQSLEEVTTNLCLNSNNVILTKDQRNRCNKALRKTAEAEAKQLSLETSDVSARIQNQSSEEIAENLCLNSSNAIVSEDQKNIRNKALQKATEEEAKQMSLETFDISARTQNQSLEEVATNLCLNSSNVTLSKWQRKRRNKALRKAAEAEAKQLSLETSDVFAITQNQSLEEVAANLCLNSSNVILSEGLENILNKALQKDTEEKTKQMSLETFDISAKTQNQSLEEVTTNLCLNSNNVILTKDQRNRCNKALRKTAEAEAKQLSLETSDVSARIQNQSSEEIAENLCLNSSSGIVSEDQKNIRNKALQKATEEEAKQMSLETFDISARIQNQSLEEVATNLCLNSSNVTLSKWQRKRRNKALRKAAEAEAKQLSLETSDVFAITQNQSLEEVAANLCLNSSNVILSEGLENILNKALQKATEEEAKQLSFETSDVSARIQNQGPEEIAANLCLNSSNVILSERQENIRNKALQKATEEEAKQLSVETFDIFAITQNQSLEEVAANFCLNSSNVILSEGLENILNKALQKATEEKTKQMGPETFDISARTQNQSLEEVTTNLCLNSSNVILTKDQRNRCNKALRKTAEAEAKQLSLETSDVSARIQNQSSEEIAKNLCLNSSNAIVSEDQKNIRNKALQKATEEEAKQMSLETFDISARIQNQSFEEVATNLCLNSSNVTLSKWQRKRRNKALRKAAEAEAKQLSLETSDVFAITQNQSLEEVAANLCLNSSNVILSEGLENILNKALQKATEEEAKQLSFETSDVSARTQNQNPEEIAANLCLNSSNVILSKGQETIPNKALRKATEEEAKQLSLETSDISARTQNHSLEEVATNLCLNSSNVILTKGQRKRRNKALRKAVEEKAKQMNPKASELSKDYEVSRKSVQVDLCQNVVCTFYGAWNNPVRKIGKKKELSVSVVSEIVNQVGEDLVNNEDRGGVWKIVKPKNKKKVVEV